MDRFRNTRQPDWDWWSRLWPTPGATLRKLGIEAGMELLEIGSGNGYFALPAARITDPAPVYALDLDEDLLDELSRLADRQGIDNIVPIRGDARSLDRHLSGPVDAALFANAFHGVDETAAFVGGVHEHLRPGGLFAVVNWRDLPAAKTTVAGSERGPPEERRLRPEETDSMVRAAADFDPPRLVDLPPYHYGLVFER